MTLAFLYAGQGSQQEGMGRDFYEAFPAVRPLFHSDAAGFDLYNMCFEAPLATLSETQYTQPCMAVFAAAVTDLLYAAGVRPQYAAGLSLGEYGALYAAGAFSAATMLDIVAYRGRVMAAATAHLRTKMVAVLGLDRPLVERAVAEAAEASKMVVSCANYNYTGQIVIGGEEEAVAIAVEKCQAYGARRCLPLNVSGPFHTPLMAEAARLLGQKLSGVTWGELRFPVLFNATAKPLAAAETVGQLLEKQVKMPVLFEQTILDLAAYGVDTIIEIGPGRVLAGFVKKTAPQINVHTIEDLAGFHAAVQSVGRA